MRHGFESLDTDEIKRICARFAPGHDLASDFQARFGQRLDQDGIDQDHAHQVVLVAASLDASSERIVSYLNRRDIPINVLCFQIFDNGGEQLLSRAWLLDPSETQVAAVTAGVATAKEPWNGEYYVNFGHGASRSWPDAVKYGFVRAGGSSWYSNTLKLLKPGDRFWVKAPGYGFVGVGRVKGSPEPGPDFKVVTDYSRELPALDVLNSATYHREFVDLPENMEYFVPVEWLEAVPLEKGVDEIGLFVNQNTVCAPRMQKWRPHDRATEGGVPALRRAGIGT